MVTKKRIDSTTWQFNSISIVALVTTALLASPEFLEAIGPMGYIVLMILGAIANNLIREKTNVPIEGSIGEERLGPIEKALAEEADERGLV